uniref:RUN domain-containing protein n=1 Tax=Globodera pallida TaxID=36090 RepID=A0A183C8H1_GLOPA
MGICRDVVDASALKKLSQLIVRVICWQGIGGKDGIVHSLSLFFCRKVVALLYCSCHCTSQASLSSFLRPYVTLAQLRFAVVVAKEMANNGAKAQKTGKEFGNVLAVVAVVGHHRRHRLGHPSARWLLALMEVGEERAKHWAQAEEAEDPHNQKVGKKWTVVTDGRSYVHLENLRVLLNQVNDNAAIIVGRKVPIERDFWRSVFSFLFPFSSVSNWPVQFALSSGESPLIFSQLSLHLLAAQCSETFRWSQTFIGPPRHAGRVIGGCALRLGIALWDPVDEESRPLIVDQNFKLLFSRIAKNATLGKMEGQYSPDPAVLATCCSDRAIAFALLNHKEQRLIDFGVHHLRVFGR